MSDRAAKRRYHVTGLAATVAAVVCGLIWIATGEFPGVGVFAVVWLVALILWGVVTPSPKPFQDDDHPTTRGTSG